MTYKNSADLEHLVEAVTSAVLQKISANKQKPTPSPTSEPPKVTTASTNSIDLANSSQNLASIIDHTLLKPDASQDQIKKLCEEAKQYKFATVCVNSSNVGLAAQLLQGTFVKAIAVVGFPLGAATASAKAFETLEAIREGAQEIDTVINVGALKSKDYREVYLDIRAVVEAAGSVPVKVILETSQLSLEEKVIACSLSKAAGAAFVKTSTGFTGGGATVDDIKLMRKIVGPEMGVKASGGVKTREDALAMVAAGATRLGTSSSIAIVTGQKSDKQGY